MATLSMENTEYLKNKGSILMKPSIKFICAFAALFCCSFTNLSQYEEENIYGFTVVKNLRVRTKPSTKSKTIHMLKENQKITILGFSDKKNSVTLRGKKITASWYKIKLKDKTGWVFGGGISLSPPAPKKHNNKISNTYEGYSVKTSSGKETIIKNENFNFSVGKELCFTINKFQKYYPEINCYAFNYRYYGGSPDNYPGIKLLNTKSGHKTSIAIGFAISPDKKKIANAYHDESGGTNYLEIYKVSNEKIVLDYRKTSYGIIFTKAEWIGNNKLKIYYIKSWGQNKKENFVYEIGKELIIPKKTK